MKYGKRRKRKRKGTSGTSGTPGQTAQTGQATRSGQTAEATGRSRSRLRLKPWWERWEPSRLDYELEQLAAAGIKYTINERARAQGRIELDLALTLQGEELRLIACFPDTYPYTRVEIRAPDLNLKRHQNPFSKGLCLIGRATRNWDSDCTLAEFIAQRVPLFLKTVRSHDPDEVKELEEHQGEPFTEYYGYKEDSLVLVDSSWSIDSPLNGGGLILGIESGAEKVLRGAVLEVRDANDRLIAGADPVLSRRFSKRIEGRWIRIAQPIVEADLKQFFEALYTHDEGLRKFRGRVIGGGSKIDVVGIVFQEEHNWRAHGQGWLFATRVQGNNSKYEELYLARSGRVGRVDLSQRIPELALLKDRSVAVFGLGGIGAPATLELARCGVGQLRILDGDVVDAATIVRWPFGLPVAGRSKVASVKEFILANYPYPEVLGWHHRLGFSRERSTDVSDVEVLGEMIDGVDLIYDATAEYGLHDLLSDLAAEHSIPYIAVTTTAGAWGGRLVRIQHDERMEGCWKCFQRWMYEEKIPIPRTDPNGGVQPTGCADPTFTGAGFDVADIALAGVRLAASTLMKGATGTYPDVDWDVAVVDLRDEHGQLIPPHWRMFNVARHPECKNETAHHKSLAADHSGR